MSAVAAPVFDRPHKRWSVEAYLRLCEGGHIGPEDRVELLEGEIVEKLGQDFPHISGIRALAEALRAIFAAGFDVSQQLPLRTGTSVPEPEVLVLQGFWRDYVRRYPEPHEVVLVAEVADESRLSNDRTQKHRIYASAGFGEYWILNLVDRQLEVHRKPLASGTYSKTRVYQEDATLEIGGGTLKVADLFSASE
jgi:Uma2 family endonuclease